MHPICSRSSRRALALMLALLPLWAAAAAHAAPPSPIDSAPEGSVAAADFPGAPATSAKARTAAARSLSAVTVAQSRPALHAAASKGLIEAEFPRPAAEAPSIADAIRGPWAEVKAGFGQGASTDSLAPPAAQAAASRLAALLQQTETRCAQQLLTPGEPVSGELAVPDCRWGQVTGTTVVSFVDQYRIQLAERSELSFTASAGYDLYLSIHDAGYGPLRNGFSSDGSDAELSITLPAGSYVLLLTTLSDAPDIGGSYTLASSLTPRPLGAPCTVLPLAPGAGSARALDAAGCRVFDWLPGILLDHPAQVYTFELTEPGHLEATISSSAIDPRHALIDDEGRTISSDLNSEEDPEAGLSSFTLPLATGSYELLVLGAMGGAGDFALESTFDAAGDACRAVRVEPTSSTPASLSDEDCIDAWLDNGISVGYPLDIYEVVLPKDGRLTIDAATLAWAPIIWLLDGNDQVFLGQASTPPLGLDLPPGTYRLAVQSADDGRGDYNFDLGFTPVNPECEVREIEANGFHSGDLGATKCQLREYYFGESTDPVDPFVLRLEQRGELVVSMRSASFDTFLGLMAGPRPDSALNISIAATLSDDVDPVAGDTNSQIRVTVPPGDYLILATNIEEVGPYQLTTAFTPSPKPAECPITDLAPGPAQTMSLDGFECSIFELEPGRLSWSPADRYRISAPARGTLAVEVTSGAFFPRLRLFDVETGAMVGDDYDTTFQVPSASLGFFTTPREYIVQLESMSDTEFRGDYEIRSVFTPAPGDGSCVESLIEAPGQARGTLEQGDCTWPEVPGGVGVPAASAPPVDLYRVTLSQVGTLSTTVSAGQYRPYVEVLNHRRALLEGEGPLSIGLPAELATLLIPGDYYLHVLSQDSALGDYDLELDFGPAAFDPDAVPTPTPEGPGETPTPVPSPTPVEPTPGPDGTYTLYAPWTGQMGVIREP